LPYLCFLNSLVCIYSYFASNGSDLKGIIGASSIDSSLTACLIPIFWENIKHHNNYLKYFLLSIVVISVILMKGSVGVACLLIVLFFMFIKHFKKIIPFLILILIASFYLTNPNTFFSGSGRFEMYKDSFDYWFKNENIFFGTGIATYWAFGPLVQLAYKTINRGDYFTHMHSDIFQFIFEFGFVGGLILLFLVVDFIKRIYKKIFLLSAFFAFCCFSMFYYPMHEFLTAFVGILIYREGLENGRKQISDD
jgi:O-antigen ligase